MNVLLIGANGYLGPHVVQALAPHHHLRITDIKPAPDDIRQQYASHEFFDLDVTSADAVLRGAEGMDAIIDLAVVRRDPVLAFRVNMLGCYNVMEAAVRHGIHRVIQTGPYNAVAGPSYDRFDFGISPDIPSQPGTELYQITESLGLEISRIYAQHHDVYVQNYLFYNFCSRQELKPGRGGVPFMVSWSDAADVFRLGLEIDLARLPSKCETFFILGDCPQGKFIGEKATRILGFRPKDDVSILWRSSS